MNQKQGHKSRSLYRKQRYRRFLNNTAVAMILLIVTALVNFQVVPNVNTYINSTNFKQVHSNSVKTNFSNKTLSIKNSVVVTVKPRSNTKEYQVYIKPVEGINNFANQVNSAAEIVANSLHKENLTPKQITLNIDDNNYFERYGYTIEQFKQLISQHYYHENIKIRNWRITSNVIRLIAIIIDVVAICLLIIYLLKK